MKYRGPLELRVENQIICYKCGECLRVPTFTGFCDIILVGISATNRHSAEKIPHILIDRRRFTNYMRRYGM